ncbi:MAG TPA: discoidin domain-containing protein, partial [Polyangia bacterium]|nr:discoidin domain-containing protein [Polyangia bacterium]
IGWGQSPSFPTQEGTFFGQIMVTNAANNLDAYYCNGSGVTADVVPGRLGSVQNSASAPYANAYPVSGGMCNAPGHCTMQASGDGAVSCVGNSITWNNPVTVWRGKTFPAESATLAGGASVISDSANSNGARVGNLGSNAGVTFTGVPAATAGVNNLVVYYTNGDTSVYQRFFNVIVNGGTPQLKGFVQSAGWSADAQASITLTGFNAGSNNTVQFIGDGVHGAPDLDWIEIIGASSNYCDHTRWIVNASSIQTGSQDPAMNAIDGDPTTRWTSGRNQDGTDWYTIDFGGFVTMSNLTLSQVLYDQNDFPGNVALYASNDGVNFSTTAFGTAAGANSQTVVIFPKQTLRAIKIKQTGTSNKSNWWSINEFDSDCAVAPSQVAVLPVGTCSTSGWSATSNVNAAAASSADDGNLSTRWTTNRAMQIGDYYQVNFGGAIYATGITLNNTQTSTNDFATSYALYGSTDGVTWDQTPFASGNGAASSTTINFAKRQLTAIRVQIVTVSGSNYWSIGDVQMASCTLN